jgi:hypothetical protein
MLGRKALVGALLVAQRMGVALAKGRLGQLVLPVKQGIEYRGERGVGRGIDLVEQPADNRNARRRRAHDIVEHACRLRTVCAGIERPIR